MEGKHELITTGEPVLTRAKEVSFLGHPKGLFYLAFTEGWERFSFYGMTALVVLYMVNQLLLPGHVKHIGGFSGFRAALESVVGPLSTQALASQIFGLYSGFVYFTPLLGGMIADRWIGQRNAVVIGALSMSAGHIAMTFDQSFLLALLLLVIGSGFLKGNISAQVGALYPPEDEARRTAVSSSSARVSISERSLDPYSAVCSHRFMAGTTASASPRSSCSSASPRTSMDTASYRRG
jgi:POT family proton-dependent oligopeptide transporter